MADYGDAIRLATEHVLSSMPESFIIGQGLWSPWYVGQTMTDLDKKFGKERVIDTPVSEAATTGATVGAALVGARPIVVHPRVDFAILAIDAMVNQAAKWTGMFGPQAQVPATVRLIINRGGSQGAQHSQSLSSWFAHVPGLKVVMPSTAEDAYSLLIASVIDPNPVIYMDDRWCYDQPLLDGLPTPPTMGLDGVGPRVLRKGADVTIVGSGFTTRLASQAAERLADHDIDASVIDLRVLNPLDTTVVAEDVARTGRLIVIDGDWAPCGIASEVVSQVVESSFVSLRQAPVRICPMFAAAPTAASLEEGYYPSTDQVVDAARKLVTT